MYEMKRRNERSISKRRSGVEDDSKMRKQKKRLPIFHKYILFSCLLFLVMFCLYIASERLTIEKVGLALLNSECGPTCSPVRTPEELNCPVLLRQSNYIPVHLAKQWHHRLAMNDSDVVSLSANCLHLKRLFCFPSKPLSKEEAEFPLAYAMIVAKNAEQSLRLLQSIYWPQNLYCLTFDKKATVEIKRFVENMAACFPNIILAHKHESIYWGRPEVLLAAMNCYETLVNTSHDWKYVQIVSWNDLPLKTNAQMVKIFKILNGSNDVQLFDSCSNCTGMFNETLFVPNGAEIPREWNTSWIHRPFGLGNFYFNHSAPRTQMTVAFPTVHFGSFASTLSRKFVSFLFQSKEVMELLDIMKQLYIPDELFIPTVVHSLVLKAPGYYPSFCGFTPDGKSARDSKPWISRLPVFGHTTWHTCFGKMVHSSCVFGVGDLPKLTSSPSLMAHKFYLDFQPAAYFCLLQWHYRNTYSSVDVTDYSFYQNMPSVRFHHMTEHQKSVFKCI